MCTDLRPVGGRQWSPVFVHKTKTTSTRKADHLFPNKRAPSTTLPRSMASGELNGGDLAAVGLTTFKSGRQIEQLIQLTGALQTVQVITAADVFVIDENLRH